MRITQILASLGAVLALSCGFTASGSAEDNKRSQASTYGPSVLPRTGPDVVNRLALSPDGRRFATSIAKNGGFYVLHANIDGSDPQALPMIAEAEPAYLSWSDENIILFAYRRTRMRQRDRKNFQSNSEKSFTSIRFVRAYNLETNENWVLNQWTGKYWETIPSLHNIANMDVTNQTLSVDFGGFISIFNLRDESVSDIDVDSGYSTIENILAADGSLRLSVREANKKLHFRCPEQEGKLKKMASFPLMKRDWPLQPVAPGEEQGESYLLARDEKGIFSKLVSFDCSAPESVKEVVDMKGKQIEGVFFNVHDQQVYGLWASGETPSFVFFDDALKARIDAVRTALGEKVDLWPVDFSRDGKSYILYARPVGMKTGSFVHIEERDGQLALILLLGEESLSR